jgi:phosphoribosylglycinamide formyltransferase 1
MGAMRSRIAVLASGGGSNLQAILDHFDRLGERRGGDVVLVASDQPHAGAFARADLRNIETAQLQTARTPSGAQLAPLLADHEIDLIVLAGYLRLIPGDVVRRYDHRIVNVHPALLPAFGGRGMFGSHVHQAVLDAGAKVSGATVHFVNEDFDRGRIIAQWPVPVLAGDDRATLAARVLRVEHLLFPRVVDAVAHGRLAPGQPLAEKMPQGAMLGVAFTMLSREDSELADDIDRALGY